MVDFSCHTVHLLAVVTFAHPAMLAALGAVALPIAIHLLYRRPPRDIVFPAIRFLREAAATQSRVHRLRHWILLLLRCVFLALLALAFAKPVWFRSADAASAATQDSVVILLLDVSASMEYVDPPQSVMSQAIVQATKILDRLSPDRGDQANVLLAGLSAQPLLVKPTANLSALKQQIERVRATAERTNVNAAITAAAEQFAAFRASRKELHIHSDMQQNTWAEADFAPLPRDVRIILHRVGGRSPKANVGITELTCEPARPILGQPCRVTVQLSNYGIQTQQRRVALRIGQDELQDHPTIVIEPGRSGITGFDLRFNKAGLHEAVAEIESDAWSLDDRRFAVFRVVDKLAVGLITDTDPEEGVSSSYFISRALAPQPNEQAAVRLRVLHSQKVTSESLHGQDTVFVDAASRMSNDAIRALFEYLVQGGGVVFFLGPGAGVDNLNQLSRLAADRSILPFESLQAVERDPTQDPVHLDVGTIEEHPLLRPFTGSAMQSLANVGLRRYYTTKASRGDASIVARLQSGDAAIASAPVGSGTLLLCNLSPDPAWSDLAKHAAFPALLHQFIRVMRPGERAEPPICAGMAPVRRWHIDDPLREIRTVDPDGQSVRAAIRREDSTGIASWPAAQKPGIYRTYAGNEFIDGMAVNVDPSESNLTALDEKEITARIDATAKSAHAPTELAEAVAQERTGKPLWAHAIAAAMGILAIEMLCLLLWRR